MQDGNKHPDTTLPSFVKRAVVAQAIVIFVLVWGYATWRIRNDHKPRSSTTRVMSCARSAAAMYVHMEAVLNDGPRRGARCSHFHQWSRRSRLDHVGAGRGPVVARAEQRRLRAGAVRRRRRSLPQRDSRPAVLAFESWPHWFDLGSPSASATSSSARASPIPSKARSTRFRSPCASCSPWREPCGPAHCSASRPSSNCTRAWRSVMARSA